MASDIEEFVEKAMVERIIIAGAGGQGIMLLGKVLAAAAMKENKFVTWLPGYGAEVRGGAAYCMVIISDSEIGSPYIDKADTLIIMNSPSLAKFQDRLKNHGTMILNSSLAGRFSKKGIDVLAHPFTELAEKLGNNKAANMVALGAYLAEKGTVAIKTAQEAIKEMAPEDKKEPAHINKVALREGIGLLGIRPQGDKK